MEQMSITSAQYVSYVSPIGDVSSNVIIKAVIDGVPMSVPLDSANRHYAEIMRQVEAGELVIQPAPSGSEDADS